MQRIVDVCQEALLRYRQYVIELYSTLKEVEEKKVLLGMDGVKTSLQIIK